MPRILAIEPDAQCGRTLKRLLRQWINADVQIVESAHEALTAIAEFGPDIVLVSELTPQSDDLRLTSRVKGLPAGRNLPILSIPPLVDDDTPLALRRGPLSLRSSEQPRLPWPYDAAVHAARVRDAVSQSRAARFDRLAMAEQLVASGVVANLDALYGREPARSSGDEDLDPRQTRAPRWKGSNIPWLSKVAMPLGLEVGLVNISRSGLLIESKAAFVVGQPTAFDLQGPNRAVIASGRFVRTQPIDGPDGPRYRAAAVFDRELRVFGARPGHVRVEPSDTADRLFDVLSWVRHEAQAGLPADRIRSAFELGVQSLVGARDVRVCDVPVACEEPGESFCFTVPMSDEPDAVLQAIYDHERPPARAAFTLLKAAAAMAADVLEMEEASRFASGVSSAK